MRNLVIMLMLLTPWAARSEWVTDAFGIVDQAQIGTRANWSGIRNTPDGPPPMTQARGADALLFFLGEKSLIPNQSQGHAVVIALDPDGNLVADGTQIFFDIGQDPRVRQETVNGIAGQVFFPSIRAGVYHAGATSFGEFGARQTNRSEFRVISELASIQPQLSWQQTRILRAEDFAEARTDPMRDQFGNLIEDGVGVQFTITHPENRFTLLSGQTMSGVARGRLLARDIPNQGDMAVELLQARSAPLDVTVTPAIYLEGIDVTLTAMPEIDATALRVGPIVSTAGYVLNDGSQIIVELEGRDGTRYTANGWVLDGYFDDILLASPTNGPFDLRLKTPLGEQVMRDQAVHPQAAEVAE
jgi:hypothetical protein